MLSTFEAPYRRRATLGRPFEDIEKNYFNGLLNSEFSKSHDLTKSVYNALKTCISNYPDIDPADIYSYLDFTYNASINQASVEEGIRLFKVYLSRQRQAAKAAEQGAKQAAAAYAAAMEAQKAAADLQESEPAAAVEQVEAVEIPEGVDISDLIAIQEITAGQQIEQAAAVARENAEQVIEDYAEGNATAEEVQAAVSIAAAAEDEKTKNTLLNAVLPLTLAAGLFIFLMKRNK